MGSAVPYGASAFERLLEPLNRREMNRIVALHGGDRGVGSGPKAWTTVRHLKALVFGQVMGLNSLRDIEHGLQTHPGSLYHLDLRPARRSTLSDALANRPAAVFRDICESLMKQASRVVRREATAVVRLIDSSPIPLRDARFAWPEADNRTRGLKLHIGYDARARSIDWLDLTSPKVNDIVAARAMPIEPGMTYVADKAYLDFAWWHEIDAAGAVFVTRLKKNTKRRDVRPRPVDAPGILEDNDFKVGHPAPRGGARNPLVDTPMREVVVERDGGKDPLRLVTNDLVRPAAEIAALYKERWQIELLFKWLKQNLRIKKFLGRSENAVKTQIYCAIITFLLLRMLSQIVPADFRQQTRALVTRLKVAILSRIDLSARFRPPPRNPLSLPDSPQLQFKLAAT
jgi:putative transposase